MFKEIGIWDNVFPKKEAMAVTLKNERVPVTLSSKAKTSLQHIADTKGLSVSGVIRQLAEASADMLPKNYYKVLAAIDRVGQDKT